MILSVPQEDGDPVEIHAIPEVEGVDKVVLSLELRRSGARVALRRTWFRNGIWTLRTDVTVRNASLEAVAAAVQEDALKAGDNVWLPRDRVLEAVSGENMSNIAVLLEVMGA